MTILDTIVDYKKKEVASSKELIPVGELENGSYFNRNTLSLKKFLLDSSRTGIIAEFKRKSPSKGIINSSSNVEEVTTGYARYGASALSVLTDFNFFGGSADDLLKVRAISEIPILRKEFIIDEYQLIEAKAIGADAILLIAAILDPMECLSLARKAHELGLEVLLEIHIKDELDRINEFIDLVGVNNRNLKNFEISLGHSAELSRYIPENCIKISESGISTARDIAYLKRFNYKGFLMGETFMKTPDPVTAFSQFVNSLNKTLNE